MPESVIPELTNLANGCAAAGDKLAAKICRDAIAEIERLKATNQRLNRRCQEVESAIKQNEAWSVGFDTGSKYESERRNHYWQHIAQKHGEKNAKLKAKVERLEELNGCLEETLQRRNKRIQELVEVAKGE